MPTISFVYNSSANCKGVSKFDHNRYWGKSSYKEPWAADKTNWPPKLKGNPHK